MMDWSQLKQKAIQILEDRNLPDEYNSRLKFEFREIEKQGANNYWLDNYNEKKMWEDNKNGLVLPWLLNMTKIDPIECGIKHSIKYQPDFPDIDLDFLPLARQTIKDFAAKEYKNVCSVGNWNTYNPKSALQDACRAMGGDYREALVVTKQLPKEFDDLTLEDHDKFLADHVDESKEKEIRQEAHQEVARYQPFYEFRERHPDIVDMAFRMVGKIKSQGTHAGGLIIADPNFPIDHIVPLALIKGNWTSQWTEGDKPQLSKFGLIKFDILGLTAMQYIWKAGVLIEGNRGIKIDWSDKDPKSDPPRAGHEIYKDGTKKIILLDDPDTLKMCNQLRTESIFQIETDIQKGIISDGKVKNFGNLVVYNALGRPGPIDMIPEYINRRDNDPDGWKKGQDKRIIQILESTFGIICFQEQLTAIWMAIAGFTVPEAEAARKVIAKKWKAKLPQVENQWKTGAAKTIGEDSANAWWEKMVTFGRYAFNLAHSVAYSLITYMSAYLKCHYPSEWWAAVMTYCHIDKLPNYMSAARLEGVKFRLLDINNLEHEYSVRDGGVVPGLQSIKGIGEKASLQFTAVEGPFEDIDNMVEKCGKKKLVFERLIKLGAFDDVHSNRRGLWFWYRYKYCSGKDITALKKEIREKFAWSQEQIEQERNRQADNFKSLNPKRKIPKKILNWKPKIDPKRDEVISLYDDFTDDEKLKLEKEFLGFYWTSPLSQYQHKSRNNIEGSKKTGILEAVVDTLESKKSKKGNTYYVLRVTDGIQTVPITVWASVVEQSDRRCFNEGVGLRLDVVFNPDRKNFRIANNSQVMPLLRVGEDDEYLPAVINDNTYPLF